MSDLTEAIKYFYEEFIVRDLVSLITPGLIVLGAGFYALFPDQSISFLSTDISKSVISTIALLIPVFGLAFMTGYALQVFGDKFVFKWWREPPGDPTHWGRLAAVISIANGTGERARMWRERFSLKKYMCANGAIALFIAGILILVRTYSRNKDFLFDPITLLVVIMTALLIVVLVIAQAYTYQEETTWEEVVIKRAYPGEGK